MLSIGSELRGDDGVGSAVVEQLRRSISLPEGVELIDGGLADFSLLLMKPDLDKLIIVDAANMDLPAGEWRRLAVGQEGFQILENADRSTLHGLGLAEALSLGRVLGILPQEVVIFAVQPKEIGYRSGLSNPLMRTVTEVCTAIQIELESNQNDQFNLQFEKSTRLEFTESRL